MEKNAKPRRGGMAPRGGEIRPVAFQRAWVYVATQPEDFVDRREASVTAPQHVLDPRSHPRPGPSRMAERLRPTHPAIAVLAVAVWCYLILAVTMIGLGLVVTHFVAHGAVGHWDEHVNSWFARHRDGTWNRLSGDFTLLADTSGVAVVAAAVTLVLLARRWGRFAVLLALGLGVELAVFLSTTYTVARPRPAVPHVGGTPSTFSWPSGHTAATLVLYGGIAVLVGVATRRRWPQVMAWTVAVALMVCVALSRIYRGEHHPIDTMGGVLLGVGALWAAVTIIRAWGESSSARTPAAEVSSIGSPEPAARIAAVRS
jgi:membrane-associated phospholipid phosphatase